MKNHNLAILAALIVSLSISSTVSQARTKPLATWVDGANTIDNIGIYGTKGVADPNNIPGARYGSISWTDSGDNHWLFGGYGYNSVGGPGCLNDLWKIRVDFDIDGQGPMNHQDFAIHSAAWLSDDSPTANWNPNCDLDSNGVIDITDLLLLTGNWLSEN